MKSKKPLIGIIGGTSQFGQWFKFFFENNGCECLVAGRKTDLKPRQLAKIADIVIISAPIRETTKVISEVRDLVRPSSLLCDFTSLKAKPLKEMLKRKRGGVLGMHPLFGPLVPSLEGQIIVFCPGRDNKWVDFLKKIFKKSGGKVIKMDPEDHDKQMAMIQAMTHFINISFARVLQKQKIGPLNIFSTPVFRLQAILAGRVLGSKPSLYTDLQIENNAFRKVLKDFIAETEKLSTDVLKKRSKKFEEKFTAAALAMKDFIPIARAKTTEIMYLLDKQPVEIQKRKVVFRGSKKGLLIACMGPEGTYSHTAAKNIFSSQVNFILTPAVTDTFKAIVNGEAKFGVVPAENSIAGVIQETLDCLLDYPVNIVGSYKMDIHHCLLARTKDKSRIRIIKSHIQPLNQCRLWLRNNFFRADLSLSPSTTEAILSTKDQDVAFVASEEAAQKYGLEILARNIEDNKNNSTEFYILGKNIDNRLSKKLKAGHTVLIITVYDRPGVLRDVLNAFANRKINLTKLHSRSSIVTGWDYYFFLEVDCLPNSRIFIEAAKEIKKYCSMVRVVGVA